MGALRLPAPVMDGHCSKLTERCGGVVGLVWLEDGFRAGAKAFSGGRAAFPDVPKGQGLLRRSDANGPLTV